MQNASLYIHQAGKGKVPRGWYRRKTVDIQRLYFIKCGTGYIIDEKEGRIPFLANHIYLFPNNYKQEFFSDPDDPIDHIYVDFTTTPPIIDSKPLVYSAEDDQALTKMVELLDSLFVERSMIPGHIVEPPTFFGPVSNAKSGSYDEYKQLLFLLITSFLVALSHKKEIPFSNDKVISDALEFMRSHYSEKIDIEAVAKHVGYNVHHFIRRFHSIMGITPYSYLRNIRLTKARYLIAEGVTLAKAADQVGYESASSLSRAMRSIRYE